MTFTVKDVEAAARLILLDTYSSAYRFEPKELHDALHDGLKHIRNVRPESRYVNGLLVDELLGKVSGTQKYFTDLGNVDDETGVPINMEDKWKEAAQYYIVHRMYLKDDADTQNAALAKQYLDMFNASVIS